MSREKRYARDMSALKSEANKSEMLLTESVFTGLLTNLPEKESSVIRIFLSSTFTDMQAERNWIFKQAVPHLRTFCQERGLDFQIADMRWGVREEATADHKTTELCLQEIRNCQRLSRGPNFVALLGDKYGYRPIPPVIEYNEFKLLKATAVKLGYDTKLLQTWYLLDDNTVPPTCVLQPITTFLPHFTDFSAANVGLRQKAQREWSSISDKLAQLLRKSANRLYKEGTLSEDTKHKYYQSVTENEVSLGILKLDHTKQVLCFQRTLIDLDINASVAGRFTDLNTEKKLDLEAEELREKLRMVKLPAVLCSDQLYRYNVLWDKSGVNIQKNDGHAQYLEKFGNDFIRTLERMIITDSKENEIMGVKSLLFKEVLHHLHFCRTKCETFCGRKDTLDEIHNKMLHIYTEREKCANGNEDNLNGNAEPLDKNEVDDNEIKVRQEQEQMNENLKLLGVRFVFGDSYDDMESDPNFSMKDRLLTLPPTEAYTLPIIIHGISGSGKTALMAKVMQMSKDWFPASVSVIRFLGASTMSSSIREVLTSLCLQLWQIYKVEKPTGIDMESDMEFLINYFHALLWKIETHDRPLILILDSVDQLHAADHAHFFNWLPHRLPANVHLLISTVSDHNSCLKNLLQVIPKQDQYIEVTALPADSAADMIDTLCSRSSRRLMRKQKNILLDQFKLCSQPLFMKLLIDTALSWQSYTNVSKENLGKSITEAINRLFDGLETRHGHILVKKAFGYLSAAREGLNEVEMEDILSLDDDVLEDTYIYHLPPDPDTIRLPPLLWKRVEYDIQEYVVERQSGTKKVSTWYHRQFGEVAKERYLSEEVKVGVHCLLAEYFQGVWSRQQKPLELTKGKKGSYPQAMRQVPEQPVTFKPGLYNTRKLNELPYHLIHSGQFESLLLEHFCDPEWLYAKCLTSSFTTLMEDFKLALSEMDGQMKKSSDSYGPINKQQYRNAKMIKDMKKQINHMDPLVYQSIELVSHIVLLSSDSVRKDPVYLPVQVLCQLGPKYTGNKYIEQLSQRCLEWCSQSEVPLLLPTTRCMTAPGGMLQYTIEVDVQLTGEKRDKEYKCMYLHDDLKQLFVIRQQSRKYDQLCVFDLLDNGSCIFTEDVNKYIRSVKFVGNNRFLLLDIYTNKSLYDAETSHSLYESSVSSPVTFPHPPSLIAVSQSGKYIVYSSANLVEICQKEESLKVIHSIQEHERDVTFLIISPDERFLVTSDSMINSLWGDKAENLKQFVFCLSTFRCLHTLGNDIKLSNSSVITCKNQLICTKSKGSFVQRTSGTILIVDLVSGQIVHEVIAAEVYVINFIKLHASHKYLLHGCEDTGVINGQTEKYAGIIDIESGKQYGKSPVNGPYNDVCIFGEDSLYYVALPWNKTEISIMFAGHLANQLKNAVVVYCLTGHSQPVVQVEVSSQRDMMFSAASDNTIKVWDLNTIIEGFVKDMHLIARDVGSETELDSMVSMYKLPQSTEDRLEMTRLVLDRSGDCLYAGTRNSCLVQFNVTTGDIVSMSDLSVGPVSHMIMSQSGQYLIVGGKEIYVGDLKKVGHIMLKPRSRITCMAESNNTLVAGTCGMEAKARVWNIETGEVLKDFELLYSLYCVAINTSGTVIVSSMFDFPVVVPLEEGSELGTSFDPNKIDTMMSAATCVAISPDEKLAVSSSTDGAVRVIQMDGSYLFRLQQRSSAVALTFTPDNESLLSAGYRSIYVMSVKDGTLRYKLTRHLDFVTDMKFDTSGLYLVTVSKDKQLVLWDFKRAVSIATFQTHSEVQSLDIAPNARLITYIPNNISEVAILRPNKALQDIQNGSIPVVNLAPTAQAVAMSFTCQKVHHSTSCCVM